MENKKYILSFSHEYDIFQKITKLEYDFPEGFNPLAQDLVRKLIVSPLSLLYGDS